MGFIDRIKSALGLGGSRSGPSADPGDGPATGGSPDAGPAAEASGDGPATTDDGPAGADGDAGAAAPSESSADDGVDVTVEHEPSSETEDAVKGTDTAETTAPDAELEDIKGIGPTYGERLREAGVDTVGDLATADAADLADRANVPESRVADWIERAKTY